MLLDTNKNTFFSPGKMILTGEHSVVFGMPALVSTIDRGISIFVEPSTSQSKENSRSFSKAAYEKYILSLFSKKFEVDTSKLSINCVSNLPQKSGLGSSAAIAYALFQALADYFSIELTKSDFFDLVLRAETHIHKNPSGIDPCAVVYGGVHIFKKNNQKQKIEFPKKYNFLLVNSGSAKESTGEMVQIVSQKVNSDKKTKEIIENIGKISFSIIEQMQNGGFTGTLLDQNQEELEKVGIVGKKAKQMIKKIKKLGGHAKITGAGGVATGSGWILVFCEKAEILEKVMQLCIQNNWENFTTTV